MQQHTRPHQAATNLAPALLHYYQVVPALLLMLRRRTMVHNATPNRGFIEAVAAGYSTAQLSSILVDGGCSVTAEKVAELLQWLLTGEHYDNEEKACILDFVIRHHGSDLMGLTWDAFKRISGLAHTNRCGNCRRPGHNAAHCAW